MLVFTAAQSGSMQVDMKATGKRNRLDPALAIHDAAGTLLAANNDFGGLKSSQVTLEVLAGHRYYLKAAAFDSSTGAYEITATTTVPPAPPPEPAPEPPPPPPPEPPPPEPIPPPPEPTPPPPEPYAPGSTVSGRTESFDGGQQLVVLGTDSADTVALSQSGGLVSLVTPSGTLTFEGTFARLLVYGFGGDDILRLTYSVTTAALIYAGDGNDTVFENSQGAATVCGEAGDDLLVTVGGGADTVTGGTGFDSLWADASDTLTDVEAAETDGRSVHLIGQFYQPVTDPAWQVSLQIAGQDIVDPSTAAAYADYSTRPLFMDGPEYNDVIQGQVGDCYFMAALSSLAQSDPGLIRQMIAPLGDGTYALRFYRGGQEVYLRVDAQLPTYLYTRQKYAQLTPDGELWVALAEKAYAQLRYGQNSYASLEGGWMDAVYADITGAGLDRAYTADFSNDAMAQYLIGNLSAGHAVSAGSLAYPPSPIVGAHGYMVKSVENVSGQWMVTVYNVWGTDGYSYDSNYYDGLVTISMDLFREAFIALSVCLA
jgi:hypothetical protein